MDIYYFMCSPRNGHFFRLFLEFGIFCCAVLANTSNYTATRTEHFGRFFIGIWLSAKRLPFYKHPIAVQAANRHSARNFNSHWNAANRGARGPDRKHSTPCVWNVSTNFSTFLTCLVMEFTWALWIRAWIPTCSPHDNDRNIGVCNNNCNECSEKATATNN